MSYQSPISIQSKDALTIHQDLHLQGKNCGAIFDSSALVFVVQESIFLTIDCEIYQWIEYHFHVGAEHILDDALKPAELHYVFQKCYDDMSLCGTRCHNVCGCCNTGYDASANLLVIARFIEDNMKTVDLSNIQVKIPSQFYEYDGSLTTGDYSPVRWLIGKKPLNISVAEIVPFSKTARPIQSFDNRILLYCHLGHHHHHHYH